MIQHVIGDDDVEGIGIEREFLGIGHLGTAYERERMPVARARKAFPRCDKAPFSVRLISA